MQWQMKASKNYWNLLKLSNSCRLTNKRTRNFTSVYETVMPLILITFQDITLRVNTLFTLKISS